MIRTANIVAMPPLVIKVVKGQILLPTARWKSEMDLEVKSPAH